ncbi:sulfur carrier protein ThiS [Sulfitobacter geojensis]|uniref:Sulfur carrier protein ThiS n=1 Tax=Sulfitobacter geojensis TaxID=1342299 RepID=A0AAE3B6W8_9RHOB|nr:sulfur carrier protein ThiS [Sulfitobacter geojensis]MBM1689495.1 sulfur carrier protein ThiS [Sulfitobacter geojensis]MBM1693561.1 sulfur carrier protein ThiS [Sulfitobacter geojensis]MBM1705727.1 sulfur carrier protein ThiS [Sulfitobacter geojensis]MBM1709785.1 sulfur carrier protein ThiS [Sulfitobacter geojensis]MBM1713851.1 sulfur carrier protein ThiS [Sulfitobacter geojensis]
MRLQLNGEPIDVQVTTLADLITAEGLGDAKIATAVNGVFVPATVRAQHALSTGDTVEILAPMQGG